MRLTPYCVIQKMDSRKRSRLYDADTASVALLEASDDDSKKWGKNIKINSTLREVKAL